VRAARERLARLTAAARPTRATTVREFSRSVQPNLKGLSGPADVANQFSVTSDGSTFLYTDWNTGDLVAKNMATGKTRPFYGVDFERSTEMFEAPVISRDGKRVAFVSYWYPFGKPTTTRLVVDNLGGGNREILYEDENNSFYTHDWSPDGNRILGLLQAPDRSISIVTLDTKTRRLERLVTLNWEYPQRAEYSPDGRFIAYDSTKDAGDRKIYLLTADGLEERVLVDSPGEDDSPLWSPDGRFLLFRTNRSGDWDLYGLALTQGKASGEPFLIKANIGERTFLRSMTSDGRLFYGEQVSAEQIVLVERNDNSLGPPRTLPAIKTRGTNHPSFAPDGKRLAYVAGFPYGVTGPRSLRIAELDGKILKEIPFGPEFWAIGATSFSPDGRRIALRVVDRKRRTLVLLLSAETGTRLKDLALDPQGYAIITGWSADGRYLYVLDRQPGAQDRLEKIDVESDARTVIPLPVRSNQTSTRISPDGRFLMLVPVAKDLSQRKIILRSLDGGSEKTLNIDGALGAISWDFDSRHLLYRKTTDKEPMFYRLSIETGVEEVLWKEVIGHFLEAVSADGRWLAFRKRGTDWRIWVLENFLPAKAVATAAR
jgi:Tol biopolymer transport system component